MPVLILGGTTEASTLARALAFRRDIAPLLSLAGRTENPAEPPVPFRIGGFGGIEGLTTYLTEQGIGAVVDATHPFAARISAHARAATAQLGLPLAVFTRPPWIAEPGDDWRSVADLDAAALALGPEPRTVFLTSGRLGLASFKRAPGHRYVLRSIDPPAPDDRPPICEVVLARGPFDAASEAALMRRHGIDLLVSKNSGGSAGLAKLHAARALKVPVVMVERPMTDASPASFSRLDDVLCWIEHHRAALSPRGTP